MCSQNSFSTERKSPSFLRKVRASCCRGALGSRWVRLKSHCSMKFPSYLKRCVILSAAAISLTSCTSLYTSRTTSFNVLGIYPEKRENGYVFRIEAAEDIGKVEAWISQDNWLYMSIPDTSVDTSQLNSLAGCPVVSNMQFFRYTGSVQVTLRLKQKFDHVSVLNYPDDNDVYVVLYEFEDKH